MKNQGCLLMRGGRGLDINRQSLLINLKVFCRQSLSKHHWENLGTPLKDLANEIHRIIPHRSSEEILFKTERAHRPKGNQSPVSQHNKVPPIIAKFTDWTFTEEIKMSFIKAAKNSRNNHIVYISQMYYPAVTNRVKPWKFVNNWEMKINKSRHTSNFLLSLWWKNLGKQHIQSIPSTRWKQLFTWSFYSRFSCLEVRGLTHLARCWTFRSSNSR